MFARGAFSLFLLLLSVSLPTHVQSQTATMSEVSTDYIEVTWKKELQWVGVDDFDITFTSEGGECFKTITCTTVTCTFNSVQCGLVPPCTPTSVTVSGGEYTAPTISLVSGPDKITELAPNITDGTLYVSWANPSTDSSPCYENTTVRINYYDEESLSHFGHEEETTSKPLCAEGHGEVEVWTEGGDGRSNSTLSIIPYTGSYMVKFLTIEACNPVDCNAIEVEWSYVPVCPDVAYFRITMNYYTTDTAPINSTSITMTNLSVGRRYTTYVEAIRRDGMSLYSSQGEFCDAAAEALRNLAAEALNTSSLRVTWDPVVCPKSEQFKYELILANKKYITTGNEYIVGYLSSFTKYFIKLQLIENVYANTYTSTSALTKPDSPEVEIQSVHEEYIFVNWYFHYTHSYGYKFYYKLTWGLHLQHEETTQGRSFRITGFSSTDEVFMVCVAAIPEGREDLASDTDCKSVADAKQSTEDYDLSGGAVSGIVIGSVFALTLLAGLFVFIYENIKSKTRTPQTLNQQQEIQQRCNDTTTEYSALPPVSTTGAS